MAKNSIKGAAKSCTIKIKYFLARQVKKEEDRRSLDQPLVDPRIALHFAARKSGCRQK